MNQKFVDDLLAKFRVRRWVYFAFAAIALFCAPAFLYIYIIHPNKYDIEAIISGAFFAISAISWLLLSAFFIVSMVKKPSKMYKTYEYNGHEITVYRSVEGIKHLFYDGKDVTKQIIYKNSPDNMVGIYQIHSYYFFVLCAGLDLVAVENGKETILH